jgi:hypothetical protein
MSGKRQVGREAGAPGGLVDRVERRESTADVAGAVPLGVASATAPQVGSVLCSVEHLHITRAAAQMVTETLLQLLAAGCRLAA